MTSSSGGPAIEDPDATLVDRARSGDVPSFEELVMRHADALYAALRRFGLEDDEAQDVAQETFVRAWRSLSRGSKGARASSCGSTGSGSTRRNGGWLSARPEEQGFPPRSGRWTSWWRRAQAQLKSSSATSCAPPSRRDWLSYQRPRGPRRAARRGGLSTRDAASVLDLGEAALKSRLHRGRMALRALLSPRLVAPSDLS